MAAVRPLSRVAAIAVVAAMGGADFVRAAPAATGSAPVAPVAAPVDPLAARGAELFALAGGCGCHTPKVGPVGAGGVGIETPFGTFYSTNLTNDRETGLGAWSDDEIDRAIRRGTRRDGSTEAPVMPYYRYAGMADDDVRALIRYLRGLPAVRQSSPEPDTWLPLPRLAFLGWWILFGRSASGPASAPSGGPARGKYLTDAVGICGDCHTPRNRFGAPDHSLSLAGTARGPGGELVPNITPDPVTGIGSWSQDDIVSLLQTGFKPDMDNVQGFMAEFVDGVGGGPGSGRAPEADLRTIAAYLRTVPPIAHAVRAAGAERSDKR